MRRLLLKRGNPKKSQAVSELAIFGALIIAAFAAVLSYIQSMNTQQSLQMRAFRTAMRLSRQYNKEVTYTIVKDSPIIDVTDPFGRPDLSRQTVSSTVVAVRKDPFFPDDEDPKKMSSREFYEFIGGGPLNIRHEVQPIKIDICYPERCDADAGLYDPYKTWVSAPITDVEYQTQKQRRGTLSKTETRSLISTTPSASVSAQNTTNLILEDQATFENNYLREIRDNVEQEPWQKRLKMEGKLLELESTLNWILTEIASYFIFGPCTTGSEIVRTAILYGVELLVGGIFNELLDRDIPSSQPSYVRVSEGYRPSDPISQSVSFSQPSPPFSVTH